MTKAGKRKIRWNRWIPLYLMGLPCFIYIFINNYMPLYGLLIAFKNYNYSLGIWNSPWSGLKNFEFMFKTRDAWNITRNTLCYNIVFIILNAVLGVTVAIFLNEIRKKTHRKIYQTLMLLPYLMSMVIISFLVYSFLGDRTGLLNSFLETLGMKRVSFYTNTKFWPFILTLVNEWRGIGYGAIIYLATIVGFDESLYEAAELDGATKWQQIRLITLPLLKSTIIMLVTLSMGGIFRSDFGLFYQVPKNQGLLYSVTDTIDTYVFRALINDGKIGLSSAASFYQSVVCFITIMIFNGLVKRISTDDALF